MIIIIDGYNLLNYIYKTNFIKDFQKKKFYEKLKKYNKEKKHEIIMVFDRGEILRPYGERVPWGRIIYSGQAQSADDYIKKYISDLPNNNVIVVTADRDIYEYAFKMEICCISPKYFYKKLKNTSVKSLYLTTNNIAIKLDLTHNDEELDKLMQEGSKRLFFKDKLAITQDIEVQSYYCKNSKLEKKFRYLLNRL